MPLFEMNLFKRTPSSAVLGAAVAFVDFFFQSCDLKLFPPKGFLPAAALPLEGVALRVSPLLNPLDFLNERFSEPSPAEFLTEPSAAE